MICYHCNEKIKSKKDRAVEGFTYGLFGPRPTKYSHKSCWRKDRGLPEDAPIYGWFDVAKTIGITI